MAEGGLLAWKVQRVKMRGPVADYSNLQAPLPDPPEGMIWKKDEDTRQWNLVREEEKVPHLIGQKEPPEASNEDEWEIVSEDDNSSDRPCLVSRPGSVRSLPNSQNAQDNRSSSSSTLASSASNENNKQPILGVDYVEHVVLPTDTLQGICLAYKISATKIRQANQFSGSTLLLAPSKLIIPLSKIHMKSGKIRLQDRNSIEFKMHAFISAVGNMGMKEAQAYLDMAEGNLEEAIHTAQEDKEWEQEQDRLESKNNIQNHEISINLSIHEAIPAVQEEIYKKAPTQGKEVEMKSLTEKLISQPKNVV